MKFVYGTENPAKLRHMREMLSGLNVEILGWSDTGLGSVQVEESGKDPLENALLKAKAYYRAAGRPVFSCDSGLYLEGVPDELQPGVHVRRVGGRSLSDDEMIAYYSGLAARYGGTLKARYRNAIALQRDERTLWSYDGEEIASSPFAIISVPHPQRIQGFPLDSISIHPGNGRYYMDLAPGRAFADEKLDQGYRSFFMRVLEEGGG